jgi:hypothetical protein
MSTLLAAAMAAYHPYLSKPYRSERVHGDSIRGFSKWHATIRLSAVAFAGAAVFGTHATLCYQFWPVACALLMVCLFTSSSIKQISIESPSRRSTFFFRPDYGELLHLRANMIEQACREPRSLLTTPYYVRRLRLIHEIGEEGRRDNSWRVDDPQFLQECRFIWEVFGVQEPPATEPDKDGFRFVDFTCKRA